MEVTITTLRDAQNGDVEAQNVLMHFLYTPVYHFVLKRTGSPEVADELTQTTFLKCYQRIAHYDAYAGTVYTWTFTIARNTLIDYYRKKKHISTDDLREVPAADITSQTQSAASAKIDGRYVSRLLSTLEEEESTVIRLRAIDEMSYKKIAEILDKSQGAVRQMYSRALKKLKAQVVSENDI